MNKKDVTSILRKLKQQIKTVYKIPLKNIRISQDRYEIRNNDIHNVYGTFAISNNKHDEFAYGSVSCFPGNCGYTIIHELDVKDNNKIVFKLMLEFLITLLKYEKNNSIIYTNVSTFAFWPLFTEFGFSETNRIHNKHSGNTIIMVIKKL